MSSPAKAIIFHKVTDSRRLLQTFNIDCMDRYIPPLDSAGITLIIVVTRDLTSPVHNCKACIPVEMDNVKHKKDTVLAQLRPEFSGQKSAVCDDPPFRYA